MRRAIIFSLALGLALISFSALAKTIPSFTELKSAIPGSASFEHMLAPLDYYVMKDASGKDIGVAFVTSSIPPEVGGYGGEIDALVGMDPIGKITAVQIIGHSESPGMMERIKNSGFFKKFLGKGAEQDFGDIEAVTGATISSQAIIEDISTSAKAIFTIISGKSSARTGPTAWPIDANSLIKGAAALVPIVLAIMCVAMPHRRRLRAITLAISFVVTGVWLNALITIGNIADLGTTVIPWRHNLPLAILMIFALAAALVRGNLYCSYICPFGALQEGAARVMPKKVRPSDDLSRSFRWLQWIVAILAIYAILFAYNSAFRYIEPFSMLFTRYPDSVTLIQAGVVLAAALFVRRVWCRFFCPTGLIISIFSELGAKLRHHLKSLRRAHG